MYKFWLLLRQGGGFSLFFLLSWSMEQLGGLFASVGMGKQAVEGLYKLYWVARDLVLN